MTLVLNLLIIQYFENITSCQNVSLFSYKLRMAMHKEDVYRLRINRRALVQTIDVRYFVNRLVAVFVLNVDDDERIRAQTTAQDKAATFLNCLEKSTNQHAYAEFRKVLLEYYPALVDELDNTNLRQSQERLRAPIQEQAGVSCDYSPGSEHALLSTSPGSGTDCADSGTDVSDGTVALQSSQSLVATHNVGKVSGTGHFVVMAGNGVNININK